jgi:hypothetical protein
MIEHTLPAVDNHHQQPMRSRRGSFVVMHAHEVTESNSIASLLSSHISRLTYSSVGSMAPIQANDHDFERVGLALLNHRCSGSMKIRLRRFVGAFGLEPIHCAIVWQKLVSIGWTGRIGRANPTHLLWTLLFLRTYPTEETLASRVGADEKTVRKWVWFYIKGISSLSPVVVSVE